MQSRTALVLFLLYSAATASAQDLDAAVSALVRISGTRNGTPVRGSGFVVGLDRDQATIVTASHVIEGVQPLEVSFAVAPVDTFPAGVVLGMESGNPRGLALFQVRGVLPVGVSSLSFEAEAQLQRGEDAYLLGFPQMAMAPLTLRRTFAGPTGNLLQLDLPAGEGFSGSPVLGKNGKVLGVVTDEDTQLTFAVKALVARELVIGWGGRIGTIRNSFASMETCVPGEEHVEAGITFVRICQGKYTMGSTENDSKAPGDEKPAHEVTLSEFWIGKTQITNEQFRRFRADHQGEAKFPVTHVSWADAEAACEAFGGRLPTEAEWEYAARAGSQTSWMVGDDPSALGEYAWLGTFSSHTVHPVGAKRANPWGLQDMYGNAWEWVKDLYGPYSEAAQTNPTGPATGPNRRSIRGGFESLSAMRSAHRDWLTPSVTLSFLSFRCVHIPGGNS